MYPAIILTLYRVVDTRYYLDVDSTFFERYGRQNNVVVSVLGVLLTSSQESIKKYSLCIAHSTHHTLSCLYLSILKERRATI